MIETLGAPLLKLPTSRSMRRLTRAPEASTSILMALVQASSRERCPRTAWLPRSENNSGALLSNGPLPIFSLHPNVPDMLRANASTIRNCLIDPKLSKAFPSRGPLPIFSLEQQ